MDGSSHQLDVWFEACEGSETICGQDSQHIVPEVERGQKVDIGDFDNKMLYMWIVDNIGLFMFRWLILLLGCLKVMRHPKKAFVLKLKQITMNIYIY